MEEFECTICMRILFKPVSISCGHTFCRNCLVKSLQTQTQCPQCREPCLTSINRLPNYIEKNYKEQLQTRVKEDEEDENQSLKYCPEKFQFGQQLPLFALQEFLSGPSEVVKFNIFEPRYIEMIERISSGDKMFAICDIKTQFTVAAVLKHVQRRHNPHYQYIYEITTVICCPLKINQILNAQMEPIEFQNKQIRENIILEKYQLYQVVCERIKDEDEIDQEMKDLQNDIKNFINSHIQNISESEKQFMMLHYDQSQLQSLQEFS